MDEILSRIIALEKKIAEMDKTNEKQMKKFAELDKRNAEQMKKFAELDRRDAEQATTIRELKKIALDNREMLYSLLGPLYKKELVMLVAKKKDGDEDEK